MPCISKMLGIASLTEVKQEAHMNYSRARVEQLPVPGRVFSPQHLPV